jgi:hypothetical protein
VVLSTEVGFDELSTEISHVAGTHKEELMQPNKKTVFAPKKSEVDIFKMLPYRV